LDEGKKGDLISGEREILTFPRSPEKLFSTTRKPRQYQYFTALHAVHA